MWDDLMNAMKVALDSYERKARLYPALLVLAPVVATAVAALGTRISILESLVAIAIACGGAFLLAQLARDAGKKGEKHLLKQWGGLPSVSIFRHRDGRLDAITKARYHVRLAGLVQGTRVVSPAEEQADEVAADVVYTAWSNYVRVRTRDSIKYSLLFKENVNYGFRRNVWGMRVVGLLVSLACAVIDGWRVYQLRKTTGLISEEFVGALAIALVFLLLWAFRFSTEWVRLPANAYAERLAEAVDGLE